LIDHANIIEGESEIGGIVDLFSEREGTLIVAQSDVKLAS
jgi:hypothetical protein